MRAFRIGRIFGIELRVDWSWVFIFVLLTWNLVDVFSRWHPDWSGPGALVVAAAASVIFFGCVVLHELAHSLVARTYGLKVRSITLFLFGGVSNIEHEPPSARAEFYTAIVGPITSIVLGAACLLLTSLFMPVSMGDAEGTWSAVSQLGPLPTLLAWLGPINIMIGLFNMVPGFPLDGGRVMRSILWRLTGNLKLATQTASAVGQGVGWLFIGFGIAMAFGLQVPILGSGLIGGLWLAFIGWFLHSAATQAATRVALDDALSGMTVEQLMQLQGPTVHPDLSIATLVHDHLIQGDSRGLPVVRDGVLLGLVSFSDIRAIPPAQWEVTQVGSIMHRAEDLSTATPQEPLAKAFERLATEDIGQLPVVVGNRLVGVLRRQDVTRWLELAWRPAATQPRGARPADATRGTGAERREAGHPVHGEEAHHPA